MLDAALALRGRGLPITLNRPSTKRPLGDGWSEAKDGIGWQAKRWSDAEIRRAFRRLGALNPGLLLGPQSGIIDIEGDDRSAEADLAKLFDGCVMPVTPTFAGRRGKHRLFTWQPALGTLDRASIALGGLEIRMGANGKGCQSLIPPSITDGVPRTWLVPLDECEPAGLPELVVQRILATANKGRASGSTKAPELIHSKRSRHKPLPESTESAVSAVLQDRIEWAIARTLPTGPRQRNRQLFEFARHLKAIPELGSADPGTLRPHVAAWHARALPLIATKELSLSWLDFLNAWKAAKYPAGQEPIVMVYQQAVAGALPTAADQYPEPELRRLVALCRELQTARGSKPFFLACRTAAELLGIPHPRAHGWLKLLVLDGVLELVTVGQRRKASEYRYVA
ncbi:MAG TPA: bifunctional DNA primase/polymerase, partial [Pirellulales bacterium]|nr:bifunctional DNA primase/polymerase [Pirellulales bacterium]